jgi:type IV pilus assembly protein PilF
MTPRPPLPPEVSRRRRRVRVLAGVAVVGLAAFAGWYYGFGPGADLRSAESALARHDPAAARSRLDRRLRWWPSDRRTLFLAARAARRADAYADAERFLTRYAAEFGSTEEYRLEWTLLGVQQGDVLNDGGLLSGTIDPKHPDVGLILEAVAKGYQAEFRFPDAIAVLTRLIEREPDHAPARVLRGTLYAERRNFPEAEEDFRKAVDLAPENPVTHAALAGFLTHTGHSREAIAHYEWMLRAKPGDPATLLGLARALADAADTPGAAARLDEVLAAHPDDATALTERARIALRLKQPAEAIPFLERATAAAPWHRDATRMLAQARSELGQTDAAVRTAARVAEQAAEDSQEGRLKLRIQTTPTEIPARWELWLSSQRTGQTTEGLAWLSEILRLDPRHAGAHRVLAEYFDRVGQPLRAAAHRTAAGR